MNRFEQRLRKRLQNPAVAAGYEEMSAELELMQRQSLSLHNPTAPSSYDGNDQDAGEDDGGAGDAQGAEFFAEPEPTGEGGEDDADLAHGTSVVHLREGVGVEHEIGPVLFGLRGPINRRRAQFIERLRDYERIPDWACPRLSVNTPTGSLL